MIEIGKFRQLGDTNPGNWPILGKGRAHGQQLHALGEDLGVAVHAQPCRREPRHRSTLGGGVAETAIEHQIARMQFVAKLNGLNRCIANDQVVVSPVVRERDTPGRKQQ